MERMLARMLAALHRREEGQGTVEYVLVMLAVAAIAIVLITWAKSGGGKGALSELFGSVLEWVIDAARKFRI
jgi:Flp pilus assembly pilin Flp